MYLSRILERKRQEVAAAKAARPMPGLMPARGMIRPFEHALRRSSQRPAVIAELKKASPSKGLIRPDYDPVDLARQYQQLPVSCLSCLTDAGFQGELAHLEAVQRAVGLPVLRKDFVVDAYQIEEAYLAGADAVLLIMAALTDAEFDVLWRRARELGLAVLVEVHTPAEADRALQWPVELLGVNNRDLVTFAVNFQQTKAVLDHLGGRRDGLLLVSESGISEPAHVEQARAWGVDALLIGETFMRAPTLAEGFAKLFGDVPAR